MIAGAGPERRRRRPAVSCSLCRRRKIRCNRECPCSNCIKSKSHPCVYDNDAHQHLGFSRTAELDLAKTSRGRPQILTPDGDASQVPSYASRSLPSSSKGSVSEVESLRSTIKRLEEQLSKVTQPNPQPPPSATPNIETTTSQIAGTFHVNHESRLDDNSRSVTRNVVIHKSRLFGASHWAQGAAMFRDVFEMIEPHIRERGPQAISGIKRCKELARVIKAQRTPQWPTPPTSDLPPKDVADELVDCYLRTVETTFRILHIPTFKTEYEALCVSDASPSTAFTVQLKLVLAIGAITYDERFSLRPSAIRWVYEAHTWLSDPDFKPRLNIQSLQSRILLLIAREIINVGGDSSWISAGALLRTALYMGLHRDPCHLPSRTALAAEMRRRLWNTVIELALQASIVSGGAPLISLSDFDCEAPGNFDDEQLLTEDPVPKADHEYTQTSIARALRKTLPYRLAIAKFLNDLGSYGSYEETLRLDAELRTSYRAVCRTLRRYNSLPGPGPSQFETRVLDFTVHFYLSCLHMPFFEQSLREASYAYSRKVVIESAVKVWCAIYPSSATTPAARRDDTLKAQLQDEDSLGPSPYRQDLFSLLSDSKVRSWNMIECGETNIKGYLLASLVSAHIEALMQGVEPGDLPTWLFQTAEQVQERCIAFMEEKVSRGYNGVNADTIEMPINTTPFMGDWEFIMSDAFFNAEPMSWVLNDESRPFMIRPDWQNQMASSDSEYSQTLQHITDAKLEELSNKRRVFLDRKAAALEKAQASQSPLEQLRVLSNGVKTCFNIRVKEDGRVSDDTHSNRHLVIELTNLDRFLKQAEYDPSISGDTLERWRGSLLGLLDVQTLKYEYATLFAQLTMEWLSTKKDAKSRETASKSDDFEELASSHKLESRKQWEEFVFTPADCEGDTIKSFLNDLFTRPSDSVTQSPEVASDNAKDVAKALDKLRDQVSTFESSLARSSQFDIATLTWVITGLLNSDLPTEKQRAVLREFQKDNTVLAELADVLNMRLAELHSWSWGAEVTVEQRRQLNGSYQIHMHEDLIQAIFLQYLGVKWSVFFKGLFLEFRRTKNIWKSPRSTIPTIDKKRRTFFLGPYDPNPNLQIVRETIHRNAYFVSQLMDHERQERRQEEGEEEADFALHARKRKRAKQMPIQVAPAARLMSTRSSRESEAWEDSDELMNFDFAIAGGSDDNYDPDQSFETTYASGVMKPANQMQARQNLLLLLSADITINKRLYGEVTCFRAQYESLYPSLPHATILAVLSFLGVSDKWISFFERFLRAPLKFADEPNAEPRPRRRGTPGSHVLSEVFGETTLFCLDFMINKDCNGESLWRVDDDLWFWSRSSETCAGAWRAIQKFSHIMGLPLSADKTGGAYITAGHNPGNKIKFTLPTGKIRWGMLYLNPESGRFEIDQEMVDGHIAELKRQLRDKEGSVFGWIQAWNSYASTFFTYNFGTPTNCFGQEHVDMMLQTHERIQREVFSSGGGRGDRTVITYLRETIRGRFGNTSIPDGYFFLPIDLGGLELSSPFINLLGLRDSVNTSPDSMLDEFFKAEQDAYASLKRHHAGKDKDRLVARNAGFRPDDFDDFLSFEEFTRYRELLDYRFPGQLVHVYDDLLRRPQQQPIEFDFTGPISIGFSQLQGQQNLSGIKNDWNSMSPYWKWVTQLYGPEIVELFGGFNVVDPGLLPIGLISQFRSGRVSWRDE
ncbi:hypothetical protein BDW62DRAFT_211719 [Aspergillus aurantiobrunneus]